MRLPFEARGPKPTAVAAIAMISSAVAAAPAVLHMFELAHQFDGDAPLAIMVSTGLLTALLTRFALRAESATRAAGWCVLFGTLLGAINVGLTVSLITLMGGEVIEAVKVFFFGSLLGIAFGAPTGLVFGAAMVVPSTAAHHGRQVGSHASAERTLAIVGGWLMIASAVPLAIIGVHPHAIPAFVVFAGGSSAFAIGGLRVLQRWWWLRRVRQGRVSGWAIEPRDDRPDDHELRPFVHRKDVECWDVLVRRIDDATPYRDRADAVPMALL